LEEVEDLLDPKFFYRANRQYIVSLRSVESFRTDIYSKLIVQLKVPANISIDISREKAQAFKNWIQ
jgi:DNA-binding LytR/AlgR family response regulator